MTRAHDRSLLLVVFLCSLRCAVLHSATIIVGHHELLPDTPRQTIDIRVAGGDLVSGIDLFVQIGDGGPELVDIGLPAGNRGPLITGVELINGTIFAGVPDLPTDIGSPRLKQAALYTLALVGPVSSVPADGTLATLSIDTSGLFAGSWSLSLSHVLPFAQLNGPFTTNFAGKAAEAIQNGLISIVPRPLQAGDANQDLTFDQRDLVRVLAAGKYLTGRPATWGDGDWDAAPGGTVGSPPIGDRIFNQRDIVSAMASGQYLARRLCPGDADQDLDFDQLDLVRVLQAGKYLTGEPATWGEGDWNGAPGGRPGDPPLGDARFNQLDIIGVLSNSDVGPNAGCHLAPYQALRPNEPRRIESFPVLTAGLDGKYDGLNLAAVSVPEPSGDCLLLAGCVTTILWLGWLSGTRRRHARRRRPGHAERHQCQ